MLDFVILSWANPTSQLSNQFHKSRIYACSGIWIRTLAGDESGERAGVARMSE
jgi:hypothetical protein